MRYKKSRIGSNFVKASKGGLVRNVQRIRIRPIKIKKFTTGC